MSAVLAMTWYIFLYALSNMVGWIVHRSKQDVFFNYPEFIEIGEESNEQDNNY